MIDDIGKDEVTQKTKNSFEYKLRAAYSCVEAANYEGKKYALSKDFFGSDYSIKVSNK